MVSTAWLRLAVSSVSLVLACPAGAAGAGKPGGGSDVTAWVETAKQQAESDYQQAKSRAEEICDQAKERANAAYEQAKRQAEGQSGDAKEAAEKAADEQKQAAEKAADQAKKAAEKAAEEAKKEAEELIKAVESGEAPIPSAAATGAAPAGAGASDEQAARPKTAMGKIPGVSGIRDAIPDAPGASPKKLGPSRAPAAPRTAESQPAWAFDLKKAVALPDERGAPARDPRVDALLRSARTHARMREFPAARRDASDALALAPQDGEALEARAQAQLRMGEATEAARDAEAAVAADPENPRRWAIWIDTLHALKDYGKALEAIERALERHPDDAALWYRKSALLEEQGRREDALAALMEAAQLDRAFEKVRASALRGGRIRYPDFDENLVVDDLERTRRRANPLAWLLAAACLTFAGAMLWLLRSRRRGAWTADIAPAVPSGSRTFANRFVTLRTVSTDPDGEWLEAKDKALERVAMVRRIGSPGDPQRRQGAAQAARAAGALRHPGLMDVYEVLEEADAVYVVTEAPCGKSAARMVAEGGRFPPGQAVSVLETVCKALDAAHARGVTHGRLTAESIVITDQGDAKLAGLGISAAESLPAPEGVRSDVRGLASSFYEMVAGGDPRPQGLPGALVAFLTDARAGGPAPSSAADLLARIKALLVSDVNF